CSSWWTTLASPRPAAISQNTHDDSDMARCSQEGRLAARCRVLSDCPRCCPTAPGAPLDGAPIMYVMYSRARSRSLGRRERCDDALPSGPARTPPYGAVEITEGARAGQR